MIVLFFSWSFLVLYSLLKTCVLTFLSFLTLPYFYPPPLPSQTGSGKTFTITGGVEKYEDRGVIPRTLSYLFSKYSEVLVGNWVVALFGLCTYITCRYAIHII